jgi:hypothetical protein
MSDSSAIAAVTAALRVLLERGLKDYVAAGGITTKPLDKARDGNEDKNQVNLFMYQVTLNAGMRNMDLPRLVKPGETGSPPLPLVLHYLLTVYGKKDDYPDPESHVLLGNAMRVLHDHPVLGPAEIREAFKDNDLYKQIERVRIVPQSISLDDLTKLWTASQGHFRTSVAYVVSVILIDSLSSTRTPLPVLTIGKDDRGITAIPELIPPFPEISKVVLPGDRPSAMLGDEIILIGHALNGATIAVRLRNYLLGEREQPLSRNENSGSLKFTLQDLSMEWPAGLYSVSVAIGEGTQKVITNELPFSLAPEITTSLDTLNLIRNGKGDVAITIQCKPHIRPEQRASLLLNEREHLSQPHPSITDTLVFNIKEAPVGRFYSRLRVDGVDSLIVKNYLERPPVFDESKQLLIK